MPFARSLDITKNENVVVAEYNFAGISGNSTIYSRVWAVPTTKSGSKSQQVELEYFILFFFFSNLGSVHYFFLYSYEYMNTLRILGRDLKVFFIGLYLIY